MKHNPKECDICDAIQQNPEKSNVQVAFLADVSEKTIRRHKKKPGDLKNIPEQFFTDVPVEIVTSRGRSIRTEDGWEKVTYRPQDLARLEARNYDDVEKAIKKWRSVSTTNTKFPQPVTEVLCMSDFQIGKTASGGGTPELVDRVLSGVDEFLRGVKHTRPEEILLPELGDVLENFDNLPTQRGTNDLDLTMQIRTARRLLTEIILRVAPHAPSVRMLSVPSNHSAVRIAGTKDFASNPNNDWGIEVSHQLEEAFSGRSEFKHVKFHRTSGHQEALTVILVDGTVVAAVHGHQGGKPEGMSNWWKGQSHGRVNNLHNADIMLHGHFHNLSLRQTGDERWIIGTSSADGGSDWFTNKTGERSTTGMTTFSIRNKMWENMRIV